VSSDSSAAECACVVDDAAASERLKNPGSLADGSVQLALDVERGAALPCLFDLPLKHVAHTSEHSQLLRQTMPASARQCSAPPPPVTQMPKHQADTGLSKGALVSAACPGCNLLCPSRIPTSTPCPFGSSCAKGGSAELRCPVASRTSPAHDAQAAGASQAPPPVVSATRRLLGRLAAAAVCARGGVDSGVDEESVSAAGRTAGSGSGDGSGGGTERDRDGDGPITRSRSRRGLERVERHGARATTGGSQPVASQPAERDAVSSSRRRGDGAAASSSPYRGACKGTEAEVVGYGAGCIVALRMGWC
jgi:hypothetical protein